MAGAPPNMDQFELYFRRADLDQDGRISGAEAVSFSQGSGLSKQVLAQIWAHADQNKTGFLGRAEFYNFLKLVTVAQKRELTPDLVKAALYGPASAKIPAPQINLGAIPTTQTNLNTHPPTPQLNSNAPAASQTMGIRGPQGFPSQQNQLMRPPRPPPPNTAFHPQHGGVSQGMPRGVGNMLASRPPTSSVSNDLLVGRTSGPPLGVTSQVPASGIRPSASQGGFGLATPGLVPSAQPRSQATTGLVQHVAPKPNDPTSPANQDGAKDSGAFSVSGNGSVSNSMFGDAFSASSSQEKHYSVVPTASAGVPGSSANIIGSAGTPPTPRPSQLESFQSSLTQKPVGSQNEPGQLSVKQNQQVPVQSSSAFRAGNSASGQSQPPWPKMTQSDVQKYTKVFMEVDTDRDVKITGEQARNLFLSWRLPREVLKQVWDLSDQDNDSMLSLREFCIALYLMERYREGRPLPRVLPAGVMFEEMPLPASGQPAAAYGNPTWRPTSGLLQAQGLTGPRPVTPAAGARPPRPVSVPLANEDMQPRQQKPKVPELEKHLLDQLSTEEQNSLNSKFQEATEADKKVGELEKEILDSREKIEFYRTKMQELILYKSRCDTRLNEIIEKVSADKREVESLAKKYEDKYKQSGDVASKLTIEEATFRDIQEKKMELYRAIVKLEQDGKPDDYRVRADQIQADLEEQVKALNERCKMYGLRAKPTSLVELPFGWQPGIQGGAADWDEHWDKFEDEGFTFVKELTLDVENIIAPPKTKSLPVEIKSSSAEEGVAETQNLTRAGDMPLEEENEQSKERARSPPDTPTSRNAVESPSKNFHDSPVGRIFDGENSAHAKESHSPHAMETQSEGVAESVFSGDKSFDEPGWGTFDSHYDTDAGWDINPVKTKVTDHERHNESSIFDSDNWGLNPIRTEVPKKSPFTFDSIPGTPALSYAGSPSGDNLFQKKSPFGFADSVPGTPAYSYAGSPRGDNLFQKKAPFGFADSVPGTPAYSYTGSPHGDNTFQNRSPFAFADSVPSTPMFSSGNSPRRFSDGPEDPSFNNFSRFDSFSSSAYDGGLFAPRESFSRFDSFRSTQDSEYDQGFNPPQRSFTRFDSMHSNADSDFGHSLFPPQDSSFTRFDSMRSTKDSSDYNHGFPSFDDSDPFGSSDPFRSSDPFKTSVESQTPRRDSDSWRAF